MTMLEKLEKGKYPLHRRIAKDIKKCLEEGTVIINGKTQWACHAEMGGTYFDYKESDDTISEYNCIVSRAREESPGSFL